MDLSQIVKDVKLTKACKIRPDKDSQDTKTINLEISFEGVTLQDVFTKALAQVVIQWQNGQGRKLFDKWTNKQVVKIDFQRPAVSAQLSPMEQFKAEARSKGIDPDDKDAFKVFLMEKLDSMD